MKKLTAISFLLLLLFNLCGYRILFHYAQQQADTQLQASLDTQNYNEADLITISVPLSMPYQTDRHDFERVDGEVNLNGTIYKYVKRKVSAGKLVLLCLPDQKKMHLEEVKSDFFKNTSDVAQNATKKSEKAKTISVDNAGSEYEPLPAACTTAAINAKATYSLHNNFLKPVSKPRLSPEQPPEFL